MKMLDGHQPKNVKLRQAGSGLHRLWDVEVLFRYDGNTTLTVKVFNTTMCRMRYHDNDDASNGSSNSDSGYSKSSSDSGCNKSSIEDEEEWSGEEEE
ncbi:B3 domain-containing protein Os03g0212300-like [Triticum dicoccoides]|uniref:B3 domain-containing protein Os03g0212300-like n=1 Tax=Triticum dicoccoides TaxID=85692 RepID=UPI0018919A62|nr:B3 domain-containing protein Os03g0212300-like [Triticum dicoccoides]